MNSKQISSACEIIDSDETVVKSWRKLHAYLEIESNSVQLQNQFNNGMLTSYELLHSILSNWVSEKGSDANLKKLCSILENLKFKNLSEKLQSFSATSKPVYFDIFPPTKTFVGRAVNLEQLQTYFEDPTVFLVKITGLGGIGKSEFAKKFADSIKDNVNCIWLSGESSKSLKQSVNRMAISINIPTLHKNVPRNLVDIFQDIVFTVKNKNQLLILLLIDNVDVNNDDVKLLLSNVEQLGYFAVVTSRHLEVLHFAGEMIILDILSPEDAQQLVQKSIPEETQEHINNLCLLLQYFPLTLQQAIAYIKRQKLVGLDGTFYKIQNYLDEYEFKKIKMLKYPLNSIEHKYKETTWLTWMISIDQIKRQKTTGTHAIDLINTISYCAADGIPAELLETIFKAIDYNVYSLNPETTIDALELLKSYSLIKIEVRQISIHRLVQEVVRLHCSCSNLKLSYFAIIAQTKRCFGLFSPSYNVEQKLLRKICQTMTDDVIITFKQNDMTQIVSIFNHILKHNDLLKEFTSALNIILKRLLDLSLYRESMQFANSSYIRLVTIVGNDHCETLLIERNVAFAYFNNGIYEEALDKYKELLKKQNRILGEKHEFTLNTGFEMGLVLKRLERYEEALQQNQQVFELQKKVLGSRHRQTIATQHSTATVYSLQERLSEAMTIYKEVLNWQTTELGPEHPQTIVTKHNIGECLLQQGDLQTAKEIFQDGLQLEVKVHGEEHSSTLLTKATLAMTLNMLGEPDKALNILNQVLESYERVLGVSHPHTVAMKLNIGKVLDEKEEYDRAREMFEEVLEWCISVNGQELNTIAVQIRLALTLHKMGEIAHSLKILQQVLVSQNKILGPQHENTLLTQSLIDEFTKQNTANEFPWLIYRDCNL